MDEHSKRMAAAIAKIEGGKDTRKILGDLRAVQREMANQAELDNPFDADVGRAVTVMVENFQTLKEVEIRGFVLGALWARRWFRGQQ